jgi:hypothetical protein
LAAKTGRGRTWSTVGVSANVDASSTHCGCDPLIGPDGIKEWGCFVTFEEPARALSNCSDPDRFSRHGRTVLPASGFVSDLCVQRRRVARAPWVTEEPMIVPKCACNGGAMRSKKSRPGGLCADMVTLPLANVVDGDGATRVGPTGHCAALGSKDGFEDAERFKDMMRPQGN